MSAGYQDIFLNQNETFSTSLTLNDVNGLPYNLTGFNVKSQAKRSYYSSNATMTFVATVTDANNGIISLSANSSITANVPSGKLVYDVIITDTIGGSVTRVLEGQIFVSPAVTF